VQAEVAFTIALEALADLGFERTDVVLTRMYVTDVDAADEVGHVHGDVFRGVNPVSTMVGVSGLIDPRLKVEIEIEAVKGRET
jgi:enamine deaminase RidA (YjgF/YER057c/UK114 family)